VAEKGENWPHAQKVTVPERNVGCKEAREQGETEKDKEPTVEKKRPTTGDKTLKHNQC
jgi:hypothetical protein